MALRGVSGLFHAVVGQVEWFCSVFASCFKDSPARPVIVEKKPDLEERCEHAVAPELTVPEVIERVIVSGAADLVLDKIQLNSQLCKRLEKRLAKARSVLKQYLADAGKPKTEALRELSFVLKRGDDLIRKCLCEDTPWLYVAVTMADIKEDVLEIELDLFWWTKVLKFSCSNASDSDSDDGYYIKRALDEHKTLYDKLSRKQNSLFQTARDDMQQLKTKLERVQAKHAEPGSDEYYLSLYLLSRLNDNKSPEVARILDQHFHDLNRGRILGHGAEGTVFKVTWLKRFKCARKEGYHDHGGLSDSESRGLSRGGRIMKSCNHPHIVQCMWFWENESALRNGTKNSCILMELMPENLYDHIQCQNTVKGRPPFALHVAIDTALQIAKAMRYLHRMKITHRDLKPSNVLVMPRSDGSAYLQVKLSDFGISRHYNGTQTSSKLTLNMGTPIYAAPEVFIDSSGTGSEDEGVVAPKFPPKADVWSFAMTFSEILTGQSPFHDVKIRKGLHLRIRDELLRPALPENLPSELHSCITKCWSLSPDVRPNFATICRDLHRAKALSLEKLHSSGAADLVLHKIQLNSQLCKRLEERLAEARSGLKQYHADAGKPIPEARRELSFVLKRGDDLIRKCLCEDTPWLYVAVTMADIKEDVLEIELDLFWWTNVLKFLCSNASDSDSDDGDYVERALDEHETLYDNLTGEQNSLFQTARDDMQQLKTKLEQEHAEPGSDEYYLSLYLLSRLNDNKSPEVARILDQHFHDLNRGDVLGNGAEGTVFKVTWLKRFKCARKEGYHDHGGLSYSESQALNKEGRIMKSCNHPHIVQCMWFWENESALRNGTKNSCILMELMPENLSHHIQRQKRVTGGPSFALHVAIDIALQIAKAMRYLHRMKITHRDLKPSNVLVMPRSDGSAYLQVKLTDFGISKHYNGTQTSSKLTLEMGTSIYAAPEVFIDSSGTSNEDEGVVAPKFPPKADVWSFAMMFSEILTGQSPFHDVKIKSRIHLRIRDEVLRPALPENLPSELHSCITKCWNLSPGVRPTFATICRDLHRAKALSLEILHSSPLSSQRRLDASSSVNDSVMDSITGFEKGQKYILIGTYYKFYKDESKVTELSYPWEIPSTGPQASLVRLKPIHRVIMEGLYSLNPWHTSCNSYGCLTGVFVNSVHEAKLQTMNVRCVEGGFLEETDKSNFWEHRPRVENFLWGAQTSDRGSHVAEFYCKGESYKWRYVYVYLRYGLSKAAVISHLWQNKILVLGDKSTADSASKDAIVMGSRVFVSMEDDHVTTTMSLSSEAS